jgi:alpha-galactosidase
MLPKLGPGALPWGSQRTPPMGWNSWNKFACDVSEDLIKYRPRLAAKGLKLGMYSDAGKGTCQNRPGGRGYEFQDARQYAAWGVDYLKYD